MIEPKLYFKNDNIDNQNRLKWTRKNAENISVTNPLWKKGQNVIFEQKITNNLIKQISVDLKTWSTAWKIDKND